jgi:hypothetical protein
MPWYLEEPNTEATRIAAGRVHSGTSFELAACHGFEV